MLKIYGFQTFNLTKVLMTAEELGLSYEYVTLNPSKGETKSPEHLARHPLGKVPVIEMDGKFLFESLAICRHLAHSSKSSLYPESNWGRAVTDQWMDYMSNHCGRWMASVYFQEFIREKIQKVPANLESILEAKEFLVTQLPVIETQLQKSTYLAGSEYTIADIIAFAYFTTHENSSVSLADFPRIQSWYKEIKQRPAYARAIANFKMVLKK